jgi:hypothetical protein
VTEADRACVLAASHVKWTVDFPKVSTPVLWMARSLDDSRPAAAMQATGATLFRGEGTLGAVVRADRLLVATGRRPNVEAWGTVRECARLHPRLPPGAR